MFDLKKSYHEPAEDKIVFAADFKNHRKKCK